ATDGRELLGFMGLRTGPFSMSLSDWKCFSTIPRTLTGYLSIGLFRGKYTPVTLMHIKTGWLSVVAFSKEEKLGRSRKSGIPFCVSSLSPNANIEYDGTTPSLIAAIALGSTDRMIIGPKIDHTINGTLDLLGANGSPFLARVAILLCYSPLPTLDSLRIFTFSSSE
ncbi:Hypothetical predicted protein, partial [Olea europaea subsp. europaea]